MTASGVQQNSTWEENKAKRTRRFKRNTRASRSRSHGPSHDGVYSEYELHNRVYERSHVMPSGLGQQNPEHVIIYRGLTKEDPPRYSFVIRQKLVQQQRQQQGQQLHQLFDGGTQDNYSNRETETNIDEPGNEASENLDLAPIADPQNLGFNSADAEMRIFSVCLPTYDEALLSSDDRADIRF